MGGIANALTWSFTAGLVCWEQILGGETGPGSTLPLLILVAIIGMPHGASDLVVAYRDLQSAVRPMTGLVIYMGLYVALAAGILLLWSWMPLSCTIGFMMVSWLHFGEQHPAGGNIVKDLLPPARWIEGGLPVWLPLLALQEQSWIAIGWLAELDGLLLMASFAVHWAPLLWALLVAGCLWWVAKIAGSQQEGPHSRRQRIIVLARWLLYAMLFTGLPPLLAFTVYFTLWHAPHHLEFVMQELGLGAGRGFSRLDLGLLMGATLIPLCIGAWAVCASPQTSDIASVVTRTTFIGLAALTVPHVFNRHLLKIARTYSSRAGRALPTSVD